MHRMSFGLHLATCDLEDGTTIFRHCTMNQVTVSIIDIFFKITRKNTSFRGLLKSEMNVNLLLKPRTVTEMMSFPCSYL